MELNEIVDVVQACEYLDYRFSVTRDGRGEIYLQAGYWEPDTTSGQPSYQLTRRWFLSPEMGASEVVQTAFKCIITSLEHRAREFFYYKGYPVFCPHFDVEALVQLCKDGKFVTR